MYKVGDKVLIEGVIIGVDEDDIDRPYKVIIGGIEGCLWLSERAIHKREEDT